MTLVVSHIFFIIVELTVIDFASNVIIEAMMEIIE